MQFATGPWEARLCEYVFEYVPLQIRHAADLNKKSRQKWRRGCRPFSAISYDIPVR